MHLSALKYHIALFLRTSTMLALFAILFTHGTQQCSGQTIDFNDNWRFMRAELDEQAAAPGFDDATWETVRLPHDWAIAGPFDPRGDGSTGKLPWRGVGWYRKSFTLDASDTGKRVYFDFDGVMAFPVVYINGHCASSWEYGYISFRVDATPYINYSGENTIAVHVDTRRHYSRWYPGAGIYRKVTMSLENPVHIAHWGIYVTTPKVTDNGATIQIATSIENHRSTQASVTVETAIADPSGDTVAITSLSGLIPGSGMTDLEKVVTIDNPRRWDIDNPALYTAHTTVLIDGAVVDEQDTPFGIRTFEFTADDGFFLNGRRVQMYGVNLHHDHGPLGAVFNTRAMERQLEIVIEMGVNAIRTSHNPPAPELLDLCDRMGLIVWDECFDKWDRTADRVNGEPLEEFGKKQIRNFVMRDRNHPSIVMWSIGNEIPNQPDAPEGKSAERVAFMTAFTKTYDPTRPVVLACCFPSTTEKPILDALDLTGWNYGRRYARMRERYPEKPIVYSESASTVSTRGHYELPLPTGKTDFPSSNQLSSYDMNAPRWADIPDHEFYLMETDTFVTGEFVWTGFDYLGEPTPFTREARSSYFGIVDLCGIPKDRYYLYRSLWRPDVTTVHLLPHWNWDAETTAVPVFVYTNGDEAELFLNGRSLGRRAKVNDVRVPENLALGRPTTASSSDREYPIELSTDGTTETRWRAGSDAGQHWWQVDLGSVQTLKSCVLVVEFSDERYMYTVRVSPDGENWKTVVPAREWSERSSLLTHDFPATDGRYLRVSFDDAAGSVVGIRECRLYDRGAAESYYYIMDRYRLLWMDVPYEPGELRAVAYKDGERIGETVMRTAGEPSRLRLTPDRTALSADGYDLSYILVEAQDTDGNCCPLADNLVTFDIDGPADIAGVGNGNPLSFEPFQANYRHLFYGKAMLIIKTRPGVSGSILVTASSDKLSSSTVSLQSR